jgi:hypothetical protein
MAFSSGPSAYRLNRLHTHRAGIAHPGPSGVWHTTVIDPTDILEHPTSSRFSILRSAEGNNVVGDYICDLLLRLPRVCFAIERVKKQTLDLGKVSISLVDCRFRWWVIDYEERSF